MFDLLKRPAVILLLITLAACGAQPTSGVDVDRFAVLVNKERAKDNLSPLTTSPKLNAAATVHANDMAATGNFSHTSRSGGTPSDRAQAQGYGFCYISENIAKGQPSEEQVVDAWMDSRDHRKNILSPSATQYGIARSNSNYWVMLLARPCT